MKQKVTKMDVFVTKLYGLTEFVYEIIKNSFFFWCYLVRGFGVITLLASIKALVLVSLDIVQKERKQTFSNFKNNYQNTDRNRFQSLLVFFLFFYLILLVLIPFPSSMAGSMWYGAKYAALLMIVLGGVILFTKPLFEKLVPDFKWTLPAQIYLLVKSAKWLLLLIGGLVIVFWFSLQNMIFFFAFAPGILGVLTSAIGEKMIQKVLGENYLNN